MINLTTDLETMGTSCTSAITAIGSVFFDLEGNRKTFYTNVSLQSCMDVGMTVDGDTIMWWMSQSTEAQKALLNPKPQSLDIALRLFSAFVETNRGKSLSQWTHATFDAPILDYAYRLTGIKNPVHFRENKDIRTLTWMNRGFASIAGNEKLARPSNNTAHNALDDALFQADYITGHLILNDSLVPKKWSK